MKRLVFWYVIIYFKLYLPFCIVLIRESDGEYCKSYFLYIVSLHVHVHSCLSVPCVVQRRIHTTGYCHIYLLESCEHLSTWWCLGHWKTGGRDDYVYLDRCHFLSTFLFATYRVNILNYRTQNPHSFEKKRFIHGLHSSANEWEMNFFFLFCCLYLNCLKKILQTLYSVRMSISSWINCFSRTSSLKYDNCFYDRLFSSLIFPVGTVMPYGYAMHGLFLCFWFISIEGCMHIILVGLCIWQGTSVPILEWCHCTVVDESYVAHTATHNRPC